MNDLRCSEINDLVAGYAADALDDDEACAVAAHLAECRLHDTELAAVRADFERLAVSIAPVEPPSPLRSNLLAAFDREVAGAATPAPAEARPAATPAPASAREAPRPARPEALEGPARRGLFSSGGLGYALAAALLVIAVGLGAWGLSRDGGGDSNVVTATTSDAGDTMQLTYLRDERVAVLDVQLAAPPEGQTYQAWQIVGGSPVSIGVLDTNAGRIAFSADLGDASAIALSVEPMGGSSAPTTTPILVTELPEI